MQHTVVTLATSLLLLVSIVNACAVENQNRSDCGRAQLITVGSVEQANQFFISQYKGKFNPGGRSNNKNCGPTVLAMALKYYDPSRGQHPEKLVEKVRLAMTGRDNVRSDTDNQEIMTGARNIGLVPKIANGLDGIDRALGKGAVVVVSGCPLAPGTYGQRLHFRHCKSGHYILIAGRQGDRYIMNDPESPSGAKLISRQELKAFMAYFPDWKQHGAFPMFAN